jgi:cell division transport system ATP-binding protein
MVQTAEVIIVVQPLLPVVKANEEHPSRMIRLAGVSKLYSPESPALADVNLDIDRGEFVFLSGPTGAGKTTLLKLLFGGARATAGDVLVLGRDVRLLSSRALAAHRRGLGLVCQEFKLLPSMTALDNVALAAEVAGVSTRESRRRAAVLLEDLGLASKRDAKPPTLSAGERQKVAVARALVNEPPLILADEPTENLDAATADSTMRLIARAHERGAAVVLATHDAALAGRSGRRVVLLEHGRVVESGARLRETAL